LMLEYRICWVHMGEEEIETAVDLLPAQKTRLSLVAGRDGGGIEIKDLVFGGGALRLQVCMGQ